MTQLTTIILKVKKKKKSVREREFISQRSEDKLVLFFHPGFQGSSSALQAREISHLPSPKQQSQALLTEEGSKNQGAYEGLISSVSDTRDKALLS